MELLSRASQILLAVSLVSTVQAQPSEPVALTLYFSVKREQDGKKYPLPVSESYQLDRDGRLRYGAYFFNMPIDMNHNDGTDWQAGKAGLQILDLATQLLHKAGNGLRKVSDDEKRATEGLYYAITVHQNGADSTYIVNDKKSPAWIAIDTKFSNLITAFEKAASRPKNPYELPQDPAH